MTYNPVPFVLEAIDLSMGEESVPMINLLEPGDMESFNETQHMKKNRHTFILGDFILTIAVHEIHLEKHQRRPLAELLALTGARHGQCRQRPQLLQLRLAAAGDEREMIKIEDKRK